MSYKKPLVVGDDNASHRPVEDGNTLTPESIPVSSDTNSLLVSTPTGLAAVLHTKDNTTIHMHGAGSATSPLNADVNISPTAGNMLRQYADGLYSAGLAEAPIVQKFDPATGTTFTPTFVPVFQSETFYIYGVAGGEYTLDISGLVGASGAKLPPTYRIRLIMDGRGTGHVNLTGVDAVYSISGEEVSPPYSLEYYAHELVVYDIHNTPGTFPYVTMDYPYRGDVQVDMGHRVVSTITIPSDAGQVNVDYPVSQLTTAKLYGRRKLRVTCEAAAYSGTSADPLSFMTATLRAGTATHEFPIFAGGANTPPLSPSAGLITSLEDIREHFNAIRIEFTGASNPNFVDKQMVVRAYFNVEAY